MAWKLSFAKILAQRNVERRKETGADCHTAFTVEFYSSLLDSLQNSLSSLLDSL